MCPSAEASEDQALSPFFLYQNTLALLHSIQFFKPSPPDDNQRVTEMNDDHQRFHQIRVKSKGKTSTYRNNSPSTLLGFPSGTNKAIIKKPAKFVLRGMGLTLKCTRPQPTLSLDPPERPPVDKVKPIRDGLRLKHKVCGKMYYPLNAA